MDLSNLRKRAFVHKLQNLEDPTRARTPAIVRPRKILELTPQKLETQSLFHLNALRAQWASKIIQVPDDWIMENAVERHFTCAYKTEKLAPTVNTLLRIRDMLAPLTWEEQQSRSLDFMGPEPDFVAATLDGPDDPLGIIPIDQRVYMDNILNFLRLGDLLKFSEHRRDEAAIYVALELADALCDLPGFFLRKSVSNGFLGAESLCDPVEFALLVRQYGSRPEAQWPFENPYIPFLWPQRQAVALAMHISDTHPAVIIGITDHPQAHSDGFGPAPPRERDSEPALYRLARQTQPSLEAVMRTWRTRQEQRGDSVDLPPWLMLFGFIVTRDVVKIVAHYPNTLDKAANEDRNALQENPDSDARFCSCVVDEIPHHSEAFWKTRYHKGLNGTEEVSEWLGPVDDDTWIRDRLRLFVAQLTIMKNSRRIAAIWDDIIWPREVLEAEDELEKRHAEWTIPTPTPSNDAGADETSKFYMRLWEEMYGDIIEGTSDPGLKKEEEENNQEKVLAWKRKLPSSFEMLIPVEKLWI